MHRFLANNRDVLIDRCKQKVARRPWRAATVDQLKNGVPLFLEQLRRTLEAEEDGKKDESLQISGASGGDARALSEIGVTAAAHGRQLLELGFTVEQVVHDYGDLCQAITDLAVERNASISIEEFRTLNRCLDNAIADAVSEFSIQREAILARSYQDIANERMGFLVHELRNALGIAALAIKAMETGTLPISGATGSVLKRSLTTLTSLVEETLTEVRDRAPIASAGTAFSLEAFVAEAAQVALLMPHARGCTLTVPVVPAFLGIAGDRGRLLAALHNLIQNAFKFTHDHSEVTLAAYGVDDRVLIEVHDHCGGLAPGYAQAMFSPFTQRNDDRSGIGLGLSIARQSIEADGGSLSVRDVAGTGCVFTVNLPRRAFH